jgi:hypothetical protein
VSPVSISAGWVTACGRLPICSPVSAISSEKWPAWLACQHLLEGEPGRVDRPPWASASTYVNEQIENVPSEPWRPWGDAAGSYRYTRLSMTRSSSIASSVEVHGGSCGVIKAAVVIRRSDESSTGLL